MPQARIKRFTQSFKKVYGAPSLKTTTSAFETFKDKWKQYPGAVDVWERNIPHVEQLFDYGLAIRKVMYTTNAIESFNSSFRKVIKKERFQMRQRY